jgi:two-component system sensor histidine kinase/response regulator
MPTIMNKKIKILHLEDSLKDSELIRSLIESGEIDNEYFLAENENEFLDVLKNENIDIILSDYSLPDYNGNSALSLARDKYSHIPFIFVSGIIGEDAAINALLNGATDYVLKNKLERLIPAIKRAIYEYELVVRRKNAELKITEKNAIIEAQNQKYIIINKELEIAKEKAEESDRIKSIFLTNLSHELRTPLNAILGFSQLIDGSDDKHQIINFAKIINKGGNQLMVIIEDLFIVSSILSKNITRKIKEVQLEVLLDKARFIINDEILKNEKPGITFSVFNQITEDVVVLADYDMFGGIMRRLILNAIKFSNSGKIDIGFNIVNENNITFYVRDQGIGIPLEKHEVIFDFFRQVQESSTKEFGGIGSGLAICKSFVEKMNGVIWVESEVGKGSIFSITLPLLVQHSKKQITPFTNYNDGFDLDLTNKTVLVVDDIESNRMYLEYILTDLGSKVLSAENGKIALDIVKKTKAIDLVLMDLNMPVMDGFESTRLIKKIRPELPIIIQTAYSQTEHIEKAMNSGCDALVKKPIVIKELIATMRDCILKSVVVYE